MMTLCKNQIFIYRKCNYYVLKVLKRTLAFKYEKPEPVTACTFAIKHFDDFYKLLFKKKWPSVRLALFCPQKQVAVVNNFGDAETVKQYLKSLGTYNLKSYFEVQRNFTVHYPDNDGLSKQNITPLKDLLEEKGEEEKEKEINVLYSENKGDKVKAWFSNENDINNSKNNQDNFVYDPEEATTSLSFDMSKAEIDRSRFVTPNTKEAGLYEFIPATKLRGLTEYISESEYYKFYQPKTEMEIKIEKELDLNFPENLHAYSFDRGEVTAFPTPKKSFEINDYLLMDGADLLAVLCLGIEHGDAVLNIWSKRESIAYCILQTLKTKILVCNENKTLFKHFNEHFSSYLLDKFVMVDIDLDSDNHQNLYDKILVDSDCTDDRLSIFETENNYFASKNYKNRFKLPEKQCSDLVKVLKMVKPGGTVLYTTTTISPVQNDGVVNAALSRAWQEYKMEFIVKDLSPALKHTSTLFNTKNYLGLKYGTLVVPFLPTNFGPRYISKIIKKN